MLLHQQRRGHQHGDLLAVLHRLERRAHRDLGLAVADVAADEPVHRDRLLHVRLDLVDAGELVRGLVVGEGVLELALPRRVRAEGVARRGLPGRVEPDQLAGDLAHRPAGPALRLLPVRAAEPVQRGRLAADVLGDLVELVGGHVEPVAGLAALAGRVLDHQVLAGGAGDGALHHLDVPADAVLLVHDEVAGPQLQRVDHVAAPRRHPAHVLGRRALAGRCRTRSARTSFAALGDEAAAEGGAADVRDAPAPAPAPARAPAAPPRSAARSTSTSRSAGPWPSVVSTTRQPSRSQRRTSASSSRPRRGSPAPRRPATAGLVRLEVRRPRRRTRRARRRPRTG